MKPNSCKVLFGFRILQGVSMFSTPTTVAEKKANSYQDPIPTWVEEYYFKGNYKTARIQMVRPSTPRFLLYSFLSLSTFGHSWVALATAGRKIYSVVLEYKTWKILVSRLDLN